MRRLAAFAVVFALIFQSMLAPIARANALEAAALQSILGVICTSEGEAHPSGDEAPRGHCELPCCLPGRAVALELPAAIVVAIFILRPPVVEPARPEAAFADVPRPPAASSPVHRPRGPPAFA